MRGLFTGCSLSPLQVGACPAEAYDTTIKANVMCNSVNLTDLGLVDRTKFAVSLKNAISSSCLSNNVSGAPCKGCWAEWGPQTNRGRQVDRWTGHGTARTLMPLAPLCSSAGTAPTLRRTLTCWTIFPLSFLSAISR